MLKQGRTVEPAAKSRLDGDDLRGMFASATALLERNVEAVNALNVFPVPDGDTGTNMFLTLRAVVESAEPLPGASATAVAEAMARGALMGARGNSGVILSQFFKGIAAGLEGASEFGAEEMATAYRKARDYSYGAVGEPVEGTMLTVIGSVADAAEGVVDAGGGLQELAEAVLVAARESVARTPTLLPVLREAGVVDAGGQGLAVILAGIQGYLAGDTSEMQEIAPPQPIGIEAATGAISSSFLLATDDDEYGYCTQLLLQGTGLSVDGIRDEMSAIAGSPVVVGDDMMVKIHVHADDPGPVLSLAVSKGTLSHVSVQNMDAQHSQFSGERRAEASATAAATAVVAVALGKGMAAVLRGLGAGEVVSGGDTMNPSVQELVDATQRVAPDSVILLPNNRNIIPAAMRAAESSTKAVQVVPTTSVPQGIAAAIAFNGELDLESNAREMQEEAEAVRTGEVTEAVRSASLNGVAVEAGELMGLLEHELVCAGGGLSAVVQSVLREAKVSEGDLVTLYWGDGITAEEGASVVTDLSDSFPAVELELVEGGQPNYHFLISIE